MLRMISFSYVYIQILAVYSWTTSTRKRALTPRFLICSNSKDDSRKYQMQETSITMLGQNFAGTIAGLMVKVDRHEKHTNINLDT